MCARSQLCTYIFAMTRKKNASISVFFPSISYSQYSNPAASSNVLTFGKVGTIPPFHHLPTTTTTKNRTDWDRNIHMRWILVLSARIRAWLRICSRNCPWLLSFDGTHYIRADGELNTIIKQCSVNENCYFENPSWIQHMNGSKFNPTKNIQKMRKHRIKKSKIFFFRKLKEEEKKSNKTQWKMCMCNRVVPIKTSLQNTRPIQVTILLSPIIIQPFNCSRNAIYFVKQCEIQQNCAVALQFFFSSSSCFSVCVSFCFWLV